MFTSQINYAIATMFEIKKGNEIVSVFPTDFDLSFENIMIEKFIPDGIHNYEEDCFQYQHLVPFQSSQLKEMVLEFNHLQVHADLYFLSLDDESWLMRQQPLQIEDDFTIKIGGLFLDLCSSFNSFNLSKDLLKITQVNEQKTQMAFVVQISQEKHFCYLVELLEVLK